jgi:hypothetical protein
MRRWLQATVFIEAALLTASLAGADQVVMRNGGRVEGVIVEQTPTTVVIETAPGRVTLSMSRVANIVRGRSPLETWRERSASLHPGDAQGWASLGRWAEQAGLGTQAGDAWARVLEADPANAEANRALGRVRVDGAWLPEDEANRARGLVEYEGRWVSLAERDALVRERVAEELADQQRHEAGVRLREAEARAREAEARAREAEAAGSQYADDTGGIPFAYAYGGYGYPYGGYGYGHGGYAGRGHSGAGPGGRGEHPTQHVRPAAGGGTPSSQRAAPAPGGSVGAGSSAPAPPKPVGGLRVPPPQH